MINRLNTEIKAAMRVAATMQAGKTRLTALRMILSDAKNIAIADKRKDVTDDDVLVAVTKGIKQCEESYNQFSEAGRTDLADIANAQLAVYDEFAPKKLSLQELQIAAETACVGATMKDMGNVMKLLMGSLPKGAVDGKALSSIVKDILQRCAHL